MKCLKLDEVVEAWDDNYLCAKTIGWTTCLFIFASKNFDLIKTIHTVVTQRKLLRVGFYCVIISYYIYGLGLGLEF